MSAVPPVRAVARAWASTTPPRVKFTAGRPKPRFPKISPVIMKVAGGLARSIGVGVIPVTVASDSSAASAWMRPNPESLSKPAGAMSRAVLWRAAST